MKENLLEPRNQNVIMCDRFLGKALGCSLLHTCQIAGLLRSKKTAVKLFRVTPNFLRILKEVCQFKRQKVFHPKDVLHLFKLYLKINIHKLVSSDNPQILRFDREPLLYTCFKMKACHGKQLKALMLSQMIPVHYQYKR